MHVFVAMPYAIKEGINFNRVYEDLIRQSLTDAGFEVFRADEELSAGNIRTDMFQELLLADLVVADLSIDNPNVWYELGVRHALRARGVIQIKCKRDRMPFDVYVDRSLTYHLKDGIPDPEFLDNEKKMLGAMAKSTMESWHGRKVSPVYHLLRYLREPDWKSLRVDEAKEFWEKQEAWERYIELARKRNRPGDILVLANEAPNQTLQLEAYKTAGKALYRLGQFDLALEQIEKCLTTNPNDLDSHLQKGLILRRLKRYDDARVWLEYVSKNFPETPESLSLLGDLEMDIWTESWYLENKTSEQLRDEAANEDALLRDAINTYHRAFLLDPSHYHSGIKALTLMYVLDFLTGSENNVKTRDLLQGGVQWAVTSTLSKESPQSKDFSARIALGDLAVLGDDTTKVAKAYKQAIVAAQNDRVALDSARQHLLYVTDLGFHSQQVSAGVTVINQALQKLAGIEKDYKPNRVFLFSGHRIDEPGRLEKRFPPEKEKIAATAISAKLDELRADKDDLGLCGGACGGDLLFAEACLQHGLRLEVRIPFDEPYFISQSVAYAGDIWRERYYKTKNHPNTRFFVMPTELNAPPKGTNSYARNNMWQAFHSIELDV